MNALASDARSDLAWKALADPARRRILDLLRARPRTTGELAERFSVSRFMVMKHLKLLVDAGLVLVVRKGRERWNHLNAVPIQEIHRRWIEPFAAAAADGLLRLKAVAETEPATEPATDSETRNPGVPPMTDADFQVREAVVEIHIDAPRETVWQKITTETSSWWPKDYYVQPEGAEFRIDARVGGHMYEDWGDGEGSIWATVTQVKKNEKLRMSAEIWPEFGGPARSIQRWELSDHEGGTRMRFSDTIYGRVTEKSLEMFQVGWQYLFGSAFKNYVEKGELPPATSDVSC